MSKENLTSACDLCPGRCCTRRFGFQFIPLTRAEARNPVLAPHVRKERKWGAPSNYIELEHRCPFLNKLNRCSIYENRPAACRGFVCHQDYNLEGSNATKRHMSKYPALLKMLRRLKLIPSEREEQVARVGNNLFVKFLKPKREAKFFNEIFGDKS